MSPPSDDAPALTDESVVRPADHVDSPEASRGPVQPRLGLTGWLRWVWRQLTSMRTALLLLLLLAFAAVPGSLVPQRSSDPNGVVAFQQQHPDLFPVLDRLQVFDTYTSAWFSAIYLLLFLSLVGCVLPRTAHHLKALFAKPPRTPARLGRMAGYEQRTMPGEGLGAAARTGVADAVGAARSILRSAHYRVAVYEVPGGSSVSAERGYLRETGNLIFHVALLGILIAVGVGGGFGYTAQRVVTVGQTFVNTGVNYDSFSPGRFVDESALPAYALTLNDLDVTYETQNSNAIGQPIDYTAHVTARVPGERPYDTTVKVNEPLGIGGTNVYLLGNGYAPTITVRNPDGETVFRESVPFLPQDANLTSTGVVKIADGMPVQLGMIGFFYPTKHELASGALTSSNPDLLDPEVTLRVYSGDLGIDDGVPVSVYALDPSGMTPVAAPGASVESIKLVPGQTVQLPGGLGSVSLDGVKRYASFDVHHDPTQLWVALFATLVLLGLLTSLFVPRRRLWVKVVERPDGSLRLEYAGLARGDDPGLDAAVRDVAERHTAALGATHPPPLP